jgi:hypothetical protein
MAKRTMTQTEKAQGIVNTPGEEGRRVSDWIVDISMKIEVHLEEKTCHWWKISLDDMGYSGPATTKDFYSEFQRNGSF